MDPAAAALTAAVAAREAAWRGYRRALLVVTRLLAADETRAGTADAALVDALGTDSAWLGPPDAGGAASSSDVPKIGRAHV